MSGKLVHVEGKASLIESVTACINVSIGRRAQPLPADTWRVLERFQQLLDGHGLNRVQLLRLVPSAWNWNLAMLSDEQQLLAAFIPEKIDWLADTFGVRREWLAGDEQRPVPFSRAASSWIYCWPSGYKQPQMFAAELVRRGWFGEMLRMTVLSAHYRRRSNGPLGQFAIVFSQPLAEWDDGEIVVYRHLVFDSLMNWDHPPCRFEAKALARWFHCVAHRHGWIPIVSVSPEQVAAVAEGSAFPGPLIPWGVAGDDQFEDRVLRFGNPSTGEGESMVAVESDELNDVLRYYHTCGLDQIRGEPRHLPEHPKP